MKNKVALSAIALAAFCLIGCATGGQPVVWTKADQVDFTKNASVEVSTTVAVPQEELEFIKNDITSKLDKLFTGDKSSKEKYIVKVTITKYDKGSAFARFMLIGLGQMYLDGSVEVNKGNPPVVVRTGEFKKNYCMGGLVGGMANMHDNMNAQVAESVAEALQSTKLGKR